jgi:purine-cytosine permease-like protein
MIAVQIADYFILKKDSSDKSFDIISCIVWVLGFALYRFLMTKDIPVGNTLPDMAATIILCIAAKKLFAGAGNKAEPKTE